MKLAPSILAADLANLAHALELCEEGGADVVHFDVMDGVFVPNLSFGIPVLKSIRGRTRLPIDVHLMVTNPGYLLDAYLDAGANWVSVHWEAATHLDRLLDSIRVGGAKAGVVLNPATPVDFLADALGLVDFVVLMSVNPGFGGQSFLPYALDKAQRLRQMIDQRGLDVLIEMDGGVGASNIRQVVAAGTDVCVAGSAIFKQDNPVQTMRELKQLAQQDHP